MRSRCSAVLFFVPLIALFAADAPPLKSAITVERGVYKKGWEHDFFRDITATGTPAETPDLPIAVPDEQNLAPDRDVSLPRQKYRIIKRHEERPSAPEEPVAATPPTADETVDDAAPVPEERPTAASRPTEKKTAPVMPQKIEQPSQIVPPQEPADPNKKQKERARELEKKRKKGNFRDPKITY